MASDYKLVLMEKLIQIHKTIPELMCTKTIQKAKAENFKPFLKIKQKHPSTKTQYIHYSMKKLYETNLAKAGNFGFFDPGTCSASSSTSCSYPLLSTLLLLELSIYENLSNPSNAFAITSKFRNPIRLLVSLLPRRFTEEATTPTLSLKYQTQKTKAAFYGNFWIWVVNERFIC